jgi:pimeloyl-ACP methyl ester carboxylesterase
VIPKPPRKFHVDVPTAGSLAESGRETRRMAVHDWGEITNQRVLVCVHGLSRNGRDFDVIADVLSKHYRVLCPDVIGRGESDWYASAADYAIPNYVAAMQKMLSDLAIKQYDWIGTSMGGLIGMAMAGLATTAIPDSGMRKFVINDIGPEIERAALDRIATYLQARAPRFSDYMTLFAAAQTAIASFGPLTDEQRHHIVSTSCRRCEDGLWEFNVDPKIAEAFVAGLAAPPVDLWPLWNSIRCDRLIIRGEHSDLLSSNTAEKMMKPPFNAAMLTVADTGHAPMLMDAPMIAKIEQFLLAESPASRESAA